MRTALILLGIGAAAAGLVYCFKDTEAVQDLLGKVKHTASGTVDSLKETFSHASQPADVMLDQ